MAKGLDNLIDFLLGQIALCGEKGASAADFKKFIDTFYAEPDEKNQDTDGLFLPINTDRRFREKVWRWLTAHPDIWVGQKKEGNKLSLSEIEALKDDAPKIFVTQERMWHEVAGHGPDSKRIPPMEFVVLSLVAASGPRGITQPDVTRLSGQDKRSVPKRTDRLVENGYIVKTAVLSRGTRTSLLTHKRFIKPDPAADVKIEHTSAPDVIYNYIFVNHLLRYEQFFDILLGMLRDNEILSMEDVRFKLGVMGKKWEQKAIWRCLRRMEGIGFVKRVKAFRPGQDWFRSLKFVREPTDAERTYFITLSSKSKAEDPAAEEDSDEDVPDHGPKQAEADDAVEEIKRFPPQWDPDRSLASFVFDFINHTGVAGSTFTFLRKRGVGNFYRRPIENFVSRLTDVWHVSQPQNLRHLSIIRDTAISGKYVHYVFRTYENFDRAVQTDDAAWEAVITEPKSTSRADKIKGYKKHAPLNFDTVEELDEWGFGKLDPNQFTGMDGTATITACANQAKLHIFNAYQYTTMGEGVSAMFQHNGKMPTRKQKVNRIMPGEGEPTEAVIGKEGILGEESLVDLDEFKPRRQYSRRNLDRPIGRPRKYPKGLEPYANHRVQKENKIRMEIEDIVLAEMLGLSPEALASQLDIGDAAATTQADADTPKDPDGNSASVSGPAVEAPASTETPAPAGGSAEPGQEELTPANGKASKTKKGKAKEPSKRERKMKPAQRALIQKAAVRAEKIKFMDIDHELLAERTQELFDKRMEEEEKIRVEQAKAREEAKKNKEEELAKKNDPARHFTENGELKSGAHVDLPGYENTKAKKGKGMKKGKILVVKSDKLKELDLEAKAAVEKAAPEPAAKANLNPTAQQPAGSQTQAGNAANQRSVPHQATLTDIWSSHFSRVAAIDQMDVDSPENEARPATPVDNTGLDPVTDARDMDVDSPERQTAPVTASHDVQRDLNTPKRTGNLPSAAIIAPQEAQDAAGPSQTPTVPTASVTATPDIRRAPSTPRRTENLPSTAVIALQETQAAVEPSQTPQNQDSFAPMTFSPTPVRFSPTPFRLSPTPDVVYAPLPPSAFGRPELAAPVAVQRALLPRPSATPLAPRPSSASTTTAVGPRPEGNQPAATPLSAPVTPAPVTLPKKRGRPPKDPSQLKRPRATKKVKTAADADPSQSAPTPVQPNGQGFAPGTPDTMAAAPTTGILATAEKPAPKKRGRKPKNQSSGIPVSGVASSTASSAVMNQPSVGGFSLVIGKAVETVPTGNSLVIGKAVETVPTGPVPEDSAPTHPECGLVGPAKPNETHAAIQDSARDTIVDAHSDSVIGVPDANNSKNSAPTTESSTANMAAAASETLPIPGPMALEEDSEMTDDVDYSSLPPVRSSAAKPRAVSSASEPASGPTRTQTPSAAKAPPVDPAIPPILLAQQQSNNPPSQRRNSQADTPIHVPPRGYFNDRPRLTPMYPPPAVPYHSPYASAPARRASKVAKSLQTPPDTAKKTSNSARPEVSATGTNCVRERTGVMSSVERTPSDAAKKTSQLVQSGSSGIATGGVSEESGITAGVERTLEETGKKSSRPVQPVDSGALTNDVAESPSTTVHAEIGTQPEESTTHLWVPEDPALEPLPPPSQIEKNRDNLTATGKTTRKRKQPPVHEATEEAVGSRLETPAPSSRGVSASVQNTPGSRSTKRKKMTEADQANPEEAATEDLDSLPAHQLPFVSLDKPAKKPKGQKKQGVRISSGGVLRFHRTKVLTEILKQCDGVFPGNSEIERPFNLFWVRDHPKDKNVDRDTIKKCVKSAVDAGNIRRLTFTFKRSNGIIVSKQILTLPSVEPTSQVVLELQKKMIQAYPKNYIPPQLSGEQEFEDPQSRGVPKGGSYVGLYQKDENAVLQKQFLPLWMQQVHRPHLWAPDDTVSKRTLERRQMIMLGHLVPGRFKRHKFPLHPEEDEDYGPWNEFQMNYNIEFPDGRAPLTIDDPNFTEEGAQGEFWTSYFNIDLTSDDDMIDDEVEHLRALTKGEIPHRVAPQPILPRPGMPQPEGGLVFHNSNPSTFDPDYEKQWITSLTDPDIKFHWPTGTFTTNYYVQRNARLSLWVTADPQPQTEDSLPWTLEQLLVDVNMPGLRRNHALRRDVQYSKFEEELIQVGYWERMNFRDDDASRVRRARKPHFINHSPLTKQDSAVVGSQFIDWGAEESMNYTPNSPPPLDESEESEVDRPVSFKRRRAQSGVVSHSTTGTMRPPPVKASARRSRTNTARTVTATSRTLPSDTAMEEAAESGNVTTAATKPRRPKKVKTPMIQDPRCVIDAEATQKFLYAMVVSRALMGGIHQETNWAIIENRIFHDFPYFCRIAFRNRWHWMKKNSPDIIKKLDEEFQRVYLLAYECGDVPTIDYEDLENYDWAGVVEWARQNIVIRKPEVYNGNLPGDRETLDRSFTLEATGQHRFWNKDHIFRENSLYINRNDSTLNFPFHAPIDVPNPTPARTIVYERIRSWARAIVMSPADKYNDKEAKQKIQRVDPVLLEQACEDLCNTVCFRKVKHGRIMPGRNFVIGERLTQTFYLHQTETQLLNAVKYKHHIDDIFRQTGKAPMKLSPMASEGEILAITNLLARGYIRTMDSLPAIDNREAAPFPKISKWGFTEGHYKTVQLDRKHLRWDLHFEPTSAYVFGNPLQPDANSGTRPPPVPAPGSEEEGMIPFWYDIHGNFLFEWWLKLVASCLHVLMSRPGAVPGVVCKSLKNVVREWEVRLMMDWLRDVGAVREMGGVGEGREQALQLGDWWWMVTDCRISVRS